MPEGMFPFGVVPFEESEGGVGFDGTGEVPFLVVDGCCKNVACQLGRERLSDFEGGNALLELFHRIVGKSNVDHFGICFSINCHEQVWQSNNRFAGAFRRRF